MRREGHLRHGGFDSRYKVIAKLDGGDGLAYEVEAMSLG